MSRGAFIAVVNGHSVLTEGFEAIAFRSSKTKTPLKLFEKAAAPATTITMTPIQVGCAERVGRSVWVCVFRRAADMRRL